MIQLLAYLGYKRKICPSQWRWCFGASTGRLTIVGPGWGGVILARSANPGCNSMTPLELEPLDSIRAIWCSWVARGRGGSYWGQQHARQKNCWYCGRDELWVISFANVHQSSTQHLNIPWIRAPWFNKGNLVIACSSGAHDGHCITMGCKIFHCGFHIEVNTLHGDKGTSKAPIY